MPTLVLALGLLVLPLRAIAMDLQAMGPRYLSARALAMGNNFLGLGYTPGYALFYDPSILGIYQPFTYDAANFLLYGGLAALDALNISFPTRFTDLQAQKSALAANPVSYVSSGQQFFTGFMVGHFALGVLAKTEFAAEDYGTGLIYYRGNFQLIPSLAFGFSLIDEYLRVGYSLQWVNQTRGEHEVVTEDTVAAFNRSLSEGSGFSQSLSVSLKLGKKKSEDSKITLVARNLLGTRFGSSSLLPVGVNNIGPPANENMVVDAAVSSGFSISDGLGVNYVFQVTDATGQYGAPLLARPGLGVEFNLKSAYGRNLFQLRLGWGSGYPSVGLGIRASESEFDLTMYTQDVGRFYHEYGDQRIALQFTFRLGKPPNTLQTLKTR